MDYYIDSDNVIRSVGDEVNGCRCVTVDETSMIGQALGDISEIQILFTKLAFGADGSLIGFVSCVPDLLVSRLDEIYSRLQMANLDLAEVVAGLVT